MTLCRLQVSAIEAPLRLDLYLAQQPGMPSRSRLKALVEEGRVRLNGQPVRAAAKVRPGDIIEVDLPSPQAVAPLPEPIPLTIIYEDSHLVVFDKPAGLITHPPSPQRLSGTLVNALLHHCGRLATLGGPIKPGIVHRLDKLTSGVMVAAKTDAAYRGLAEQFKSHSIQRRYLAVVYGEMETTAGTIQSPLGRSPKHRLRITSQSPRGRHAVTHFRLLARQAGLSLLELSLETGRTHQIRVHLSENNHPVVSDPLYSKGRNAPANLSPQQKAALRYLKRQALHAFFLGFRHPISNEEMAFVSPLPEEIAALVNVLGLASSLTLPPTPRRVK